jgi:iron complex transport system substrate-binding protein
VAAAVTFGLLTATGCAGSGTAAEPAASQAATGYPLTISNCGRDYTFPAAPQRIVTTSLPATEMVLSLGLGDRLVGTVPTAGSELPQFRTALAAAPKIAEKAWPAPGREAVLGVDPDIVLSGYIDDYGKDALGDRADLAGKGLNSYLLQGSCGTAPAKAEDVLADIDNLGRIFGIPGRAAELRETLATQLSAPAPDPGTAKKVFVYEGQEDKPLTDGADALVNDLIARAGGTTIFPDQKTFGEVSWEEVIKRDPDAILIVDQGDFLDPTKARAFLTSNPSLRGITAVKDQRFLSIGVTDLQPGVRNGTAIQALRAGLSK